MAVLSTHFKTITRCVKIPFEGKKLGPMTQPVNLRASVGVTLASDTFDAPMLTTAQQRCRPPQRTPESSEYVGYALGDTASNFFFQTFNIFLTYYYGMSGHPATRCYG